MATHLARPPGLAAAAIRGHPEASAPVAMAAPVRKLRLLSPGMDRRS